MIVTGKHPEPCTGIEAYEQLRSRALGPRCQENRPMGYGLVVHRGLLTWMRTADTREVLPTVSAPAMRLPEESELVHTIVSLILGSGRHPDPQINHLR